jgi:hypothetical protein
MDIDIDILNRERETRERETRERDGEFAFRTIISKIISPFGTFPNTSCFEILFGHTSCGKRIFCGPTVGGPLSLSTVRGEKQMRFN